MSDINSPQAVQFCNTQVRTGADKGAQLYHMSKRILEQYDAQNMASAIPDTLDVVADGSVTDGRPVITGAMVTAFMGALQQYVETVEANDNQLLKLILQIAPNPA